MAKGISDPVAEDLGYLYDTIHGRIALADLPKLFHPALKSALSSEALSSLKTYQPARSHFCKFFPQLTQDSHTQLAQCS